MITYQNCSTLYISPDGKGSGKTYTKREDGTLDTTTFEKALSLIEQMRGGGIQQPITLKFMAGEYFFASPVTIRNNMSNIVLEPFGDGEVLFTGSKKIEGFQKGKFNGVDCFVADIPEAKDKKWVFTDLYVDGLHAELPFLPEEGLFKMKTTEVPEGQLGSYSHSFQAEEADLAKFSKLYDFESTIISFNHYWVDEHTPIRSFDANTGWITMEYHSRFLIKPGQDYVVENVAEAFHKPNQWYLDRINGKLYYIPRDPSQTPENIVVYAPVATKLLSIEGKRTDSLFGVTIRNIHFANTRSDYVSVEGAKTGERAASDGQAESSAPGVITTSYAQNVTFTRCRFTQLGMHAIRMQDGSRNNHVEECEFYDCGASAVVINGGAYGTPLEDRTTGCSVTDCKITHMGQHHLCACGILVMQAAETDILHNEIGDLYYSGISCGWTWGYAKTIVKNNRIMKNHIYNLGQGVLSDMGGVYLLGSQPGTIVSGNLIHDITCKEYGGWALYTDEGSAGITLENNICYNTSSNSYHQHYGTQNVVRNNIFADAKAPLLAVTRAEAHLCICFTQNILYASNTPIIRDFTDPTIYRLADDYIVNGQNLMFCHEGEFKYSSERYNTLKEAQKDGLEEGSIMADPQFKDPKNHNYALKKNSPALKLGFTPIDTSDVGPRTSFS